jgi:hypothetical protein
MRLVKFALIGMVVGLISGQVFLHARGVPDWPYDKLWETADLVVVIEPLNTENNDDQLKIDWDPAAKLQGLTTHFKIHSVFKGGPISGELVLKHFSYKPEVSDKTTVFTDWPQFIRFTSGPLEYNESILKDTKVIWQNHLLNQVPMFLAFLKKTDDGTYVAVTGQVDPSYSFRDLREVFQTPGSDSRGD